MPSTYPGMKSATEIDSEIKSLCEKRVDEIITVISNEKHDIFSDDSLGSEVTDRAIDSLALRSDCSLLSLKKAILFRAYGNNDLMACTDLLEKKFKSLSLHAQLEVLKEEIAAMEGDCGGPGWFISYLFYWLSLPEEGSAYHLIALVIADRPALDMYDYVVLYEAMKLIIASEPQRV